MCVLVFRDRIEHEAGHVPADALADELRAVLDPRAPDPVERHLAAPGAARCPCAARPGLDQILLSVMVSRVHVFFHLQNVQRSKVNHSQGRLKPWMGRKKTCTRIDYSVIPLELPLRCSGMHRLHLRRGVLNELLQLRRVLEELLVPRLGRRDVLDLTAARRGCETTHRGLECVRSSVTQFKQFSHLRVGLYFITKYRR